MSINNINGSRFSRLAETNPNGASPEQIAEAERLREELRVAQEQLEGSRDYYTHLSMEEQAKIESMKTRIQAEISLLDTFIETGVWPGIGAAGEGFWKDLLEGIDPGWHGDGIGYIDQNTEEFWAYEDQVYTSGETLEDVITIPRSSGDPTLDTLQGSAVGFVLPYSDDGERVNRVVGRTVKEDIWVTAYYEGGETKTWILKGLATRPDVMIYISAQNCQHGVEMDFSRVVRVADNNSGKFGSTDNGLVLIGGMGDDVLIGSQSGDQIIGWEGNDKIYGMGGWDTLFGGGVVKEGMDSPLVSTNDGTDGDDYIDGGAGYDSVFGGGANDVVVQDIYQANGDDVLMEYEDAVNFASLVNMDDLYDLRDSFSRSGGWNPSIDDEKGEMVLARSGSGTANSITLNAPEGYTMVSGEEDGMDWVVTFARMGVDEDGDTAPEYIRVRVKGILAEGNQTTFTINACSVMPDGTGSIVDLSRLHSEANIVHLNGNSGYDTLMGPITNLDDLHIRAENIEDARDLTRSQMEEIRDSIASIEDDGESIWSDGAAIEGNEIVVTPRAGLDTISMQQPEGFLSVDGALYEVDGNDIIVYAIHRLDAADGTFDLLRIRLKGAARGENTPAIYVAGHTAEPIGTVAFDGGAGEDLIVGSIGSTTDWGDGSNEDALLQGWRTEAPEDSGSSYDPDAHSDSDGVPDAVEEMYGTDINDPNDYPSFWPQDSGAIDDNTDDEGEEEGEEGTGGTPGA